MYEVNWKRILHYSVLSYSALFRSEYLQIFTANCRYIYSCLSYLSCIYSLNYCDLNNSNIMYLSNFQARLDSFVSSRKMNTISIVIHICVFIKLDTNYSKLTSRYLITRFYNKSRTTYWEALNYKVYRNNIPISYIVIHNLKQAIFPCIYLDQKRL